MIRPLIIPSAVFLIALLCPTVYADPRPSSPEHLARASIWTATPVPTATNTPTPIPTATQTSTPEPTVSPTPEPTASATPTPRGRCIHEISFTHIQSQFRKAERTWIDQRRSQDFSCLTEIINNIVSQSGGRHDPSRVTQSWGYARSYLWAELLRRVGRNVTADYESNRSFISCSGQWASPRADRHNAHFMIGGGQVGGRKGQLTPGCSQGRLFLTDQCLLVPAADAARDLRNCPTNVTSITSEIATPLSLVWSEEYKTLPSTIVNFKLAPDSGATQWLWRGSSALPLVVYDPLHKGEITSATQLFGSWAFGGKEATPLTSRVQWRNGFEALATLDLDRNGELADKELSELGLWFDENRDAISQPGEVKKLSQVGVKKIFLEGYASTKEGFYASNGYQRVKNNVLDIGASLDWIEKSHDKIASDDLSLTPDKSSQTNSKDEVAKNFAGIWGWNLDLPAVGNGLLLLEDVAGSIEGATITATKLGETGRVAESVEFQEFVASSESTLSELSFQFPSPDGATITNKARLSDNGQEMIGKTIVSNSSRSSQGWYEYSWSARRLK
jgi:hypothetical protein